MGGRQKSEGDRQETGDRRLSAVTRSQAWEEERRAGFADDGWYEVLRRVSTVPRLLASCAGFPAPFSFRLRRVRRLQRGMRRGARTARCTLRSGGREWWCGGKRRGERWRKRWSRKKCEAVSPRSACPGGASTPKQRRVKAQRD